jgi:hypothetical protein
MSMKIIYKDGDGHHLVGKCKNCGSAVVCWPCNFVFPVVDDYVWICSGEGDRNCVNNRRPEFGSQDEPEWIIKMK